MSVADKPIPPTVTVPGRESESGRSDYLGMTLDDRYRLDQLIGRGGMGSVFLAKHVVIGRSLAVKILDARNLERGLERLFREAQTAAAIGHPNIIEVVDVGTTTRGDPYIVMEYLLGEDLAAHMARVGAVSVATALAILDPILLALRAAHDRGIVHRDIKPSNIYLVRHWGAPATVKLIDFGIAKVLGPTLDGKLTQTGTLLGTPSYMSPEQAVGMEELDARVDLYAVGVILYELVTGELPFRGANYNELLYRIVRDNTPRPTSPIETLPSDLCALVETATRKVASERFQSADEMLEAFHQLEAWSHREAALAELEDSIEITIPGINRPAPLSTPTDAKTKLSSPTAPPANTRPEALETLAEGHARHASETPKRARSSLPAAIGALLAAGLVAAFMLIQATRPSPPFAQVSGSGPTRPSAAPVKEGIEVTIKGAPKNATIYYDRAPVAGRTFRVRRSELVTEVRVELAGHTPFVTTIVPSKDTIVRARLDPVEQPPPPSATGAPLETAPNSSPPRAPTRPDTVVKPGLGKLGRDTYYTEEFK